MPLLASCDIRSAFEMTFDGRKLPVPTIRANDMINTGQNGDGGPASSLKNLRAGNSRISSPIGGERQFWPRPAPPAYHATGIPQMPFPAIAVLSDAAAPAGCWSARRRRPLDSFQYLSKRRCSRMSSVPLLMSQAAADRH